LHGKENSEGDSHHLRLQEMERIYFDLALWMTLNAIVNDLEKENRDLNFTESFATVTSISLWFGWLHS
jgi:hypothetical protein